MNNLVRFFSAIFLIVGMPSHVLAEHSELEIENIQLVQEFYNLALNEKDFDAASKYLGPEYIQHNPFVTDGPEGLKSFVDYLKESSPEAKGEIKRVFADEDHVVLHILYKNTPDHLGEAVVDIFRVEDGKIVEHWDVFMDIVAEPANDNGML